MPSLDSVLSTLLRTVALCELQVESARLSLARKPGFSLEAVARYLDKWGLGRVDEGDLARFLKAMAVDCDARGPAAIVWQYDRDGDGKLSKEELKGLILPSTDLSLMQTAFDRGYVGTITSDILLSLKGVFEQELLYHRLVSQSILPLLALAGFTATDAFRRMDVADIGGVDRYGLEWFLNRHEVVVSEGDVSAIIRRWDGDKDGIVAFREFCDALRHPMALILKPKENRQPTPEEAKTAPKPSLKPAQTAPLSVPKPTQQPHSSQWSYQLEAAISLFKEQIDLHRELDRLRQEVSECADFTLEDAYLFLDRRDFGQITSKDLKSVLESESVSMFGDDGELLIQHYSIDGRLSIEGFSDMVEPRSARHRGLLHSHVAQRVRAADRPFLFRSATKAKYIALLRHLMHIERRIESRRQALTLRDFSPCILFAAVAGETRPFWTVTEVRGIVS